jgi:hypothetical protein
VAALSLSGCGTPTPTELCEDINDDCSTSVPSDECADEGERLATLAEQKGCEGAMEAYLECLDEDICAWSARCDAEWSAVNDCVGTTP